MGVPVEVTMNVPAVPAVNTVLLALVMEGATLTVKVKFWVETGNTPLRALKTML
jgi:hypothetical protein